MTSRDIAHTLKKSIHNKGKVGREQLISKPVKDME
jgi:hypothetical protein